MPALVVAEIKLVPAGSGSDTVTWVAASGPPLGHLERVGQVVAGGNRFGAAHLGDLQVGPEEVRCERRRVVGRVRNLEWWTRPSPCW